MLIFRVYWWSKNRIYVKGRYVNVSVVLAFQALFVVRSLVYIFNLIEILWTWLSLFEPVWIIHRLSSSLPWLCLRPKSLSPLFTRDPVSSRPSHWREERPVTKVSSVNTHSSRDYLSVYNSVDSVYRALIQTSEFACDQKWWSLMFWRFLHDPSCPSDTNISLSKSRNIKRPSYKI